MTKDRKQTEAKPRKTIIIACEGKTTLPLDVIEEFQGELKHRTKQDVEKIQKSILEYGFSTPFFIWSDKGRNYCLDGHGRIKALANLRKQGYDLPMFPVVYIKAENETEAKQKLLLINSHYGNITQSGLEAFISIDDINYDLMNFTVRAGDIAKSFQQDDRISEKTTSFPVIIAMNPKEYEKIKSLKEKYKIKKDEALIQLLIQEAASD